MHIAIVGFGPRGLAAAEYALAGNTDLKIDIFDPCKEPAAGPNFRPDEPPDCLLNLPLHTVDLPPSAGGEAVSFHDFIAQASGPSPDPDLYAPRHMLGRYLSARFSRLRDCYPHALTHHAALVTDAWCDRQGWRLMTADATLGPFDALLLAPGQPISRPDEQLTRWQHFATSRGLDLMPAYPGRALVKAANNWGGKTVAIRGLGLSAFDVVAMLTLGMGGRLTNGRYEPSGHEPKLIVPFSRDGLPPMPKPCMAEEPRYALDPQERAQILARMRDALDGDPADARQVIAAAMTRPATRIAGQDADAWLAIEVDPDADHPTIHPVDFLRHLISMAEGRSAPSVEYTVGQIWRELQSDLRVLFHEADGNPATRAAIIAIDHGLKRVTYGPPLTSARLMLALVEAGLVQLSLADGPDIELCDKGWTLDADVTAQVMIDAVLPGPKLAQLDDPLIGSLLRQGHLRENPATGAIQLGRGGKAGQRLSVLGRLGEGASIATDSIHDCFGVHTRAWAKNLAIDAADQKVLQTDAHT